MSKHTAGSMIKSRDGFMAEYLVSSETQGQLDRARQRRDGK